MLLFLFTSPGVHAWVRERCLIVEPHSWGFRDAFGRRLPLSPKAS